MPSFDEPILWMAQRVADIKRGKKSIEEKADAIGYAEHSSRSHHAVIRVYDESGNVIETHGHEGHFKEW